jgi:hypothetical protein
MHGMACKHCLQKVKNRGLVVIGLTNHFLLRVRLLTGLRAPAPALEAAEGTAVAAAFLRGFRAAAAGLPPAAAEALLPAPQPLVLLSLVANVSTMLSAAAASGVTLSAATVTDLWPRAAKFSMPTAGTALMPAAACFLSCLLAACASVAFAGGAVAFPTAAGVSTMLSAAAAAMQLSIEAFEPLTQAC